MKTSFSLKLAIRLALSTLLVFPQGLWAEQIEISRPEIVAGLLQVGPGLEHLLRLPNGSTKQIRTQRFTPSADGKSLKVDFVFVDKVMEFDFVNETEMSFRPIQKPSSQKEHRDVDSGHSWSVGANQALTAGFFSAAVLSTPYFQQIEQASRAIAELEKKLGVEFKNIVEGRINISTMATAVTYKSGAVVTFNLKKLANDFNDLVSPKSIDDVASALSLQKQSIEFQSKDPVFLQNARDIETTLNRVQISTSRQAGLYRIGHRALLTADEAFVEGDFQTSQDFIELAALAAHVLANLNPVTSVLTNAFEAITGRDFMTGRVLSSSERTLATIALLTSGAVRYGPRLWKYISDVAGEAAPWVRRTWPSVVSFFGQTGNGFALGEISSLRKVNLRSLVDERWGLTPRHIGRHFFGESRLALKNIDPQGNPDLWMQNISRLMQNSASRTLENGAIEVVDTFVKQGSNETYKMGLRLWQKEDGTFDLITVLTDQNRFR